MTEDLTNIYAEAEKYLKSSLRRWRQHLPELWEDAYQEGMIQVWRDVEAGVTPKLKILRRGAMSAEKFIHRNGEFFFGKPVKSREGISTNNTSVQKIQVFLEEYLPVHDWVYPSAKVVSQATGLGVGTIHNHMKNIREGRLDHMKYREDGRKDWNHYSSMSVELLNDTKEGSNRSWTDNPQLTTLQSTFEDLTVENLDLINLLNQLADDPRETLYLYLFQGMNPTEIARRAGKEYNSNSKGTRTLNAAISQIKMLLAPYEGECTQGHARTPETSVVKKRVDGYFMRICTTCRKVSGGDKSAQVAPGKKTGRPPKTHCPKNHKKDQMDSHGRLRCSKCRAEAQRNYTAKRRAAE